MGVLQLFIEETGIQMGYWRLRVEGSNTSIWPMGG